jgi:hypothetical protein
MALSIDFLRHQGARSASGGIAPPTDKAYNVMVRAFEGGWRRRGVENSSAGPGRRRLVATRPCMAEPRSRELQ